MQKELTCVECPMGCKISVVKKGDSVEFSGYSCPRGKVYAENEIVNPLRVVTTTVKLSTGGVLPVKTLNAIAKTDMKNAVAKINKILVTPPISVGDVVVKNVFGSDVISTKTVK